MEPIEDINCSYEHIRTTNSPRPQTKGYYLQDYKGFYLHLNEFYTRGIPYSNNYLHTLSILYNVPAPIHKKK
jgi:hypothetical protein